MHIEKINNYNITQPEFKAKKIPNIKEAVKPVTELVGASILAAQAMHNISQTKADKNLEEPLINSSYLSDKVKNIPRVDGDLILKTFDFNLRDYTSDLVAHLDKLANGNVPDAILFINYIFSTEFFGEDYASTMRLLEHRVETFSAYSDKNNSEIVKTIFTNFSKPEFDTGKMYPRFNTEEILKLINIYHETEEKDFVIDLVKDCMLIDRINLTPYRFNVEEIQKLVKTYEKTPYKEYMLELLAQRSYDPEMGIESPVHESVSIINLVNACHSKEEAELLTKALKEVTVVDEENEADVMPFYFLEDFYNLKKLYDQFPTDVAKLMSYRGKGPTGKDEPRFSPENIESFIAAKQMFGDGIYDIIESTENDDMLESIMENLCAKYQKTQAKIDTSAIPQAKKKKFLS